jgi:hypothetical protein
VGAALRIFNLLYSAYPHPLLCFFFPPSFLVARVSSL